MSLEIVTSFFLWKKTSSFTRPSESEKSAVCFKEKGWAYIFFLFHCCMGLKYFLWFRNFITWKTPVSFCVWRLKKPFNFFLSVTLPLGMSLSDFCWVVGGHAASFTTIKNHGFQCLLGGEEKALIPDKWRCRNGYFIVSTISRYVEHCVFWIGYKGINYQASHQWSDIIRDTSHIAQSCWILCFSSVHLFTTWQRKSQSPFWGTSEYFW